MSDKSKVTDLKRARIHYLDPKGESDQPVDVLTSSDSIVVEQEIDSEGNLIKRKYLKEIINTKDDSGKEVFINEMLNSINKRVKELEEGKGSNINPPSENTSCDCKPGTIEVQNTKGLKEIKNVKFIEV